MLSKLSSLLRWNTSSASSPDSIRPAFIFCVILRAKSGEIQLTPLPPSPSKRVLKRNWQCHVDKMPPTDFDNGGTCSCNSSDPFVHLLRHLGMNDDVCLEIHVPIKRASVTTHYGSSTNLDECVFALVKNESRNNNRHTVIVLVLMRLILPKGGKKDRDCIFRFP